MDKLVFRIPSPALLAVLTITICATPIAWTVPGAQVLYLVPAGYALWVVRNRTTVDSAQLVARSTFRTRVLAWDDVKAIKVVRKGWLSAVLRDGSLVRLPAVRAVHLSALSAVSGGRVPDPDTADDSVESSE